MKKLIALLLAILMVFALGACGGESGGNGGNGGNGGSNDNYEAAINTFLEVKYNNAADKIEGLVPEKFWKFYEENYNMPRKSVIDEAKYVIGQTQIELKEQFGDDYKVTPTLSDVEKVTGDKLSKIAAAFEEQKGIKASDIKDAYELKLSVACNGGDTWEEFEIGVIKIDGAWYCVGWDIYDEGTAVRFLMEEIPFAG